MVINISLQKWKRQHPTVPLAYLLTMPASLEYIVLNLVLYMAQKLASSNSLRVGRAQSAVTGGKLSTTQFDNILGNLMEKGNEGIGFIIEVGEGA